MIVINDTASWHSIWLPSVDSQGFEKSKADWNKLCGYFSILNNYLSKNSNKFHWLAGFNVCNVWVHFPDCVFAFNPYRRQSNMTDATGCEKSKDSQAICWKWDISRESQPIIIAESRWQKKKGSWQGCEQEIWWGKRGKYTGFLHRNTRE